MPTLVAFIASITLGIFGFFQVPQAADMVLWTRIGQQRSNEDNRTA
jgi:hypothetical protein